MDLDNKALVEEDRKSFEYGDTGKMRMLLQGTFEGDVNRFSLILVPLTLSDAQLNEIQDYWLTEQEFELGLPPGSSCYSSSYWVLANDPSREFRITDKYDAITNHVVGSSDNSLDSKINAVKKNVFHTSQEAKLLFWIGAEFEYDTSLSLCGRVFMQNKHDENLTFTYPSIKEALIDWKKVLLQDPHEYKKEIAFIEKLESADKKAKNSVPER